MILSYIQDIAGKISIDKDILKTDEVSEEAEKLDTSADNTFESEYLRFNEKIEKERFERELIARKK
jgi:hypothetical protein